MDKHIRRIKLIYSLELAAFAVVFVVLGILELLKVIQMSENFQLIFKIITLAGATWLFVDFFWTYFSKKRRPKNSILDKAMLLPVALYLYVFDIYAFINPRPYEYYQIGVPIAFFYLACAYGFQAAFHYFHPVPAVNEMIEEVMNENKEPEVVEEESVVNPADEAGEEKK